MALGAGLRFAVPEIYNIATAAWTDAIGARAFGPNGEIYRVMYHADSDTKAAGVVAFPALTASTNSSASTRLYQYTPFVVGTAISATDSGVGVFPSSVPASNIGWVQVGGPFTATASDTGTLTAGSTGWHPISTHRWEKIAAANINSVASKGGAIAVQIPIISTTNASTTVVLNLISPRWY